ncbi:MAG: hypothetical protein Q4D98_14400 [Planctomycetia bacterium]|nr:hypothetical protein [Planctomycetia bacterium]
MSSCDHENAEKRKTDALNAAAEIVQDGFQSVSTGGRTVTNLPLKDLIDLDKHLAQQKAAQNPANALKISRLDGGSTRW